MSRTVSVKSVEFGIHAPSRWFPLRPLPSTVHSQSRGIRASKRQMKMSHHDSKQAGHTVEGDKPVVSAGKPTNRDHRKLSELFEVPVHASLLERVFDHLIVKDILTLCQVSIDPPGVH